MLNTIVVSKSNKVVNVEVLYNHEWKIIATVGYGTLWYTSKIFRLS